MSSCTFKSALTIVTGTKHNKLVTSLCYCLHTCEIINNLPFVLSSSFLGV